VGGVNKTTGVAILWVPAKPGWGVVGATLSLNFSALFAFVFRIGKRMIPFDE